MLGTSCLFTSSGDGDEDTAGSNKERPVLLEGAVLSAGWALWALWPVFTGAGRASPGNGGRVAGQSAKCRCQGLVWAGSPGAPGGGSAGQGQAWLWLLEGGRRRIPTGVLLMGAAARGAVARGSAAGALASQPRC